MNECYSFRFQNKKTADDDDDDKIQIWWTSDIKHEVSIALISRVQPTQGVICDVRLVRKGIHKWEYLKIMNRSSCSFICDNMSLWLIDIYLERSWNSRVPQPAASTTHF